MPATNMKIMPPREVAVFEHRRLDERPVLREHVHDEHVEAHGRDDAFDDDLHRLEPQLRIAAVEHQLHRSDGDAEQREAAEVERPVAIARAVDP